MNALKVLQLNLFFYVLFPLFTVLLPPIVALGLAIMRPFSTRRQTLRRIRLSIAWYARVVVGVLPFPFIRVQYEDSREDLMSGPWIYISNHRSLSDPFLMGCLHGERVSVIKRWPLRIPVLGIISQVAGFPCADLLEADELLDSSKRLIDEGVSIVSFPEGTRSRTGEMGPFHSGIFRLALATRVSIVPVCITGNLQMPRPGSLILHPGTAHVKSLPAIPWESYKDLTPFQLKNKVREMILSEVHRLEAKT